MLKRALYSLIALLAASLVAGTAAAQLRIDHLEVVVWPEYDRPAVLVILRADLSADTDLPAIVPLPMPTAAGTPHAVAKVGANGNLLVAQHSIEVNGDWSVVKVLTDSPQIRLEYYVPLDTDNSQRRYRFYWPPGIPIERLSYEVLHPIGATNMSVTPAADQLIEADGLTFYQAELGSRSGAESFSLSLAYAKSTAALSSPAAQAAVGVSPTPAAETAREQAGASLPWIPVTLISLAIVIGLLLMFRRPRQPGTD